MSSPRGGDGPLWAITSYYNPAGYRTRRENYRRFREALGVPLVAVELAFGDDFELRDGDADILIQLRDGNVMWQKERLLNIALKAAPPSCRKVAWIDADVIFGRADWAAAAAELLDRRPLVQLFSHVHYVPPGLPREAFTPATAELSRKSVAFAAEGAPDPVAVLDEPSSHFLGVHATGMAWAARRDLLDQIGLYDACILGGADRAMIAAAWGGLGHGTGRLDMGEAHARHFAAWAKPFHDAIGGRVGTVEGDIYHLWHGAMEKRGRAARHRELRRHGYDPHVDIVPAKDGSWRWNSDKPAMHDYVRSYFASREEDG